MNNYTNTPKWVLNLCDTVKSNRNRVGEKKNHTIILLYTYP